MNILLLTHKLPYPLHDGYNLHNYNYVKRLSGKHTFHLVSLGEGSLPDEIAGWFDSIEIIPPRPPTQSSLLRRLRYSLSVDEVFDFDPAFMAAVERVLDAHDIDVVWTSGAKMLVYSHRLPRDLPVLGDIADEAAREAINDVRSALKAPRQLAVSLKNLSNTWRFQRKYLAHARICSVVSEGDREMLARNCPDLEVRVIQNGVDGSVYKPLGEPEDFPSLVFEGAMDFLPNVEGIVSFCEETLPLVREVRPDIHMIIVGKNPSPAVQALAAPGVTVTGFVDDVRPWVDRASVFVCPLRRGVGIKNKILQAWAMAKPVVATTVSCGGLNLARGKNIEIADEPRELADRILELLDDPERRAALGAEARQTVLDNYAWETKALRMEAILEDVMAAEPV